MRRSRTALGGMRTAKMASQAFAEAIRWLTGQMPQMRAISDGISEKGRPSQNFSKPLNCVTWKWASSTLPSSSRWIEILEWPSMRVTGSMTMVCRGIGYPNVAAGVGRFPSSRSLSTEKIRSADGGHPGTKTDRKSTRLNSSHLGISYAVFCLKKKQDKKSQDDT